MEGYEGYSEEDEYELSPDEEDHFEEDGLGEDGYGISGSEPAPLGGIYGLFNSVRKQSDSTKVSNLDSEELGQLGISVRECLRVASIAKTFKHPKFAQFFKDQAEIVTSSSMAKKGWFTELFVTSKKHALRGSSSTIKNPISLESNKKWRMFSRK
jgi:hypothetical protein